MTFLAACLGARRHEPAALCTSILSAQGGLPQLWRGVDVAIGAALVPLFAGSDRPPLGETADGRWALAFDARLDERPALARQLGLSGVPTSGDLLMAAWQRWGADTPAHLYGDFAIIAWDRRDEALVLARDPFGQRPLFFRSIGRGFAAASMPAGLAAPFGDRLSPDLGRLTRDLNHRLETGSSTYYAGIEAVEPGTCVTLRAGHVVARGRHWQPDPSPRHGRSTAEWGEALRAALLQAAADRIPDGASMVASQLSAGLDSAGVTAAASRSGVDVVGLTAVPIPGAPLTVAPGRLADEGPLAAAAAAHLGITHVPVSATQSFATLLDDAFAHFAQPLPNAFNYPWVDGIFGEVARRGIDVLMCGQSGNFTFSVAAGQAPSFSPVRALLRTMVPPGLRAWLRGDRARPADWTLATQLLPPEAPRSPTEQGLTMLRSMDPGALMRGVYRRWRVDLRDVTADRRLIELALRIPDAQRVSGGLDRAPARLALDGMVPDAVRLSTQRGYQAADWLYVMTNDLGAIRAEVAAIAGSPTARSLIDVPRLERLVADWPRGFTYQPDVERLYRHVVPQAIAIAGWARRAAGET